MSLTVYCLDRLVAHTRAGVRAVNQKRLALIEASTSQTGMFQVAALAARDSATSSLAPVAARILPSGASSPPWSSIKFDAAF